ncbi:MAG: hypothetical protein KGL16_10235 [Acidobacteriota bacterium]|nr:hypothetical protein [Acidobacteriota bacterium]
MIEKPAALLRKIRNTWLSGMSPVAVERASAESAPAAEPDAEGDDDEAGAVVPAGVEELDGLVEDPQPLITRPAISAQAIAGFWMERMAQA